jgi:hypothetical protein
MQPQSASSRRFFFGFLACLALLPACARYLPPPEASPYHKVSLRIACPAELSPLFTAYTSAWASRHQAQLAVLPPESPVSDIDIKIIRPAELPSLLGPAIVPIPDSLATGSNFEWPGLLPFYRETLTSWDKQKFAVPILGESLIFVYRNDLFTPQRKQAYIDWQKTRKLSPLRELETPSSWEALAQLAEFFRDTHPLRAGTASLPPLSQSDYELDELFYTVAASYARRAIPLDENQVANPLDELFSFHFDLLSMRPRLDTPGFVAAAEILTRLQNCRPPGVVADPRSSLLEGRALFALVDASVLARLQREPKLRDQFAIAQIPGAERFFQTVRPKDKDNSKPMPPLYQEVRLKSGTNRVPYFGGRGYLAVVSASSKNAEAAFDLLADLAGPRRSLQYAIEPRFGGGPIRVDQLMRDRWDAFDLAPKQSQALKASLVKRLLQHGLKNPVFCLRIPDEAARRQELDSALRKMLLEKADPAKALAEVVARWEQLAEKTDKKRLLRDYRISLGLIGD